MSTRRYISSLGEPYFAMVARNICDANTCPGGGATWMRATFRVDQLPPVLSSADEIHPILGLYHDFATRPPILHFGVTPNGALSAENVAGDVYKSRDGIFSDASRWYEVAINYDFLNVGNEWSVYIDDAIGFAAGTMALPVLPQAGYNTHFMVFNGISGISRTKLSLATAEFEFQDFGGVVYAWSFDIRGGSAVTPERVGVFPPQLTADGVLRPEWYDPLVLEPYGVVPTGTTANAYRRGIETEYTKRAKPSTKYTREPE